MKKWNVATVRAAKGREKLGCCTAYDSCFARLADEAGVPIILVGDSQGMNCLGYETTLPVNMSDTLAAVAAVARGAKDAMVVGDMPFGSYQCGDDEAVKNAVAIIKAGADAVKLEGGASVCGLIRRLTTAGIPVLAHVGMTPQSVNEYGGFKKQGKTREAAEKVLAENGYLIKVVDVVGVKIGDAPGKLTSALGVLDKANINVEYLYAFMARTEKHAYVVLRVEDNSVAETALTGAGFKMISEVDINKL